MHARRLESTLASQGWIYGPWLLFARGRDNGAPVDVIAASRLGDPAIVGREYSLHELLDYLDSHFPPESRDVAPTTCGVCGGGGGGAGA